MAEIESGRAGTGAVLSLSAIGKQDTYSDSDNPKDSFFHYKKIESTNSTLFFNPHIIENREPNNISNNWPFGRRIVFNLDPKSSGDILTNAYLKCKLPSLSTMTDAYASLVGQSLIKQVDFNIDGQTIDSITGDWLVLHSQLFIMNLNKDKKQLQQFFGPDKTTNAEINLLIPLNLFFCRDTPYVYSKNELISHDVRRPYFFISQCWANKSIEIAIEFNTPQFFSNVQNTNEVYLDKINLITQEASLTNEELEYYNNTDMIIPYSTVIKEPVYKIKYVDTIGKIFFTSANPVKSIFWFARNIELETNPMYWDRRFNFSNDVVNSPPKETKYPILNDMRFYLNNQTDSLGFNGFGNPKNKSGEIYFKNVESFQHHLATPNKNIYTLSFCIDPKNPTPTGSVNLTTLANSTTFLEINLSSFSPLITFSTQEFNIHTFCLSTIILQYKNGFCSSIFN